jgi:hypothetical protein
MAAKTLSELVEAVRKEVEELKNSQVYLRTILDQANPIEQLERIAVLENQVKKLETQLEEHKTTRAEAEELGALKNRLTQLEEEKKRGETRAFQVMILFLGSLLTLAIQFALLFLKK